ncbi:MAG TPA: hypothetical protein VH476_07785 [Solirubrobacterales bacterium]|jgi:hypothetical protein
MAQRSSKGFSWLRWTVIGCAGWIVLMIALGAPAGIIATPAAGPIFGWLTGGAIFLITGAVTRR